MNTTQVNEAMECLIEYGLSTSIPNDVSNSINILRKYFKQLDTQPSNELTESILTKGSWHFYNSNGYLRKFTLLPNGKISYNSPVANETTWELRKETGKPPILLFLHSNGSITCEFLFSTTDHTGKWQLHGPYLPKKGQWTHYLIQD